MKSVMIAILFFLLSQRNETGNQWTQEAKADPLTDAKYQQFVLNGSYKQAPKVDAETAPELILHCLPGRHRTGNHLFTNGHYLSGAVTTSAVLSHDQRGVPLQYRRDDGKVKEYNWSSSTDGTSAFIGELPFNDLLFGHLLPHKENTGPMAHKLVIRFDEAFGAAIVIQFDLPDDSQAPLEACGLIVHKE